MRILTAAVFAAVLAGSLVPRLRQSARARASGLVAVGLAVAFEALVGLTAGGSLLDALVLLAGLAAAVEGVRHHRALPQRPRR